jgi:hypothetical protein
MTHSVPGDRVSAETPAGMLTAAADLIEQRGWCQRKFQDDDGRLCVEGAIYHGLAVLDRVCFDAVRILRRHIGDDSLIRWNDQPGRTQDQVVAALRAAAEQAAA